LPRERIDSNAAAPVLSEAPVIDAVRERGEDGVQAGRRMMPFAVFEAVGIGRRFARREEALRELEEAEAVEHGGRASGALGDVFCDVSSGVVGVVDFADVDNGRTHETVALGGEPALGDVAASSKYMGMREALLGEFPTEEGLEIAILAADALDKLGPRLFH